MREGLAWMSTIVVIGTGWCQEGTNGRSTTQNRDAEMSALQAAMQAESSVREAALRGLVATDHEEVAKDAVVALIRLHASDTETLGLGLVPRLSEMNMRSVLAAAEATRDGHLRTALARGVLQRTVNEPTQAATPLGNEFGVSAAGMAATLLAEKGNRADRDLIASLARIRPHDPGLWLALAKMGLAKQEEFALANSVIQDTKAPARSRLAAATALAPGDANAREFVVSRLTSYLSKFAPMDAGATIGRAMGQPAESYDSTQAAEFMFGLRIIGILEFLQTRDAERLTFEYIDAPNELVRRALGLVAAMRWPVRLIELNPSHVEERTKLLAALSIYHPELLPSLQSLVSADELEKTRSKLLSEGILANFWLPGSAGLVF